MDSLDKRIKSGELRVLGSVKEPFVASGKGKLGVMLASKDGSQILCHECGKLKKKLGRHITAIHGLGEKQYKTNHGLLSSTSLSSPVAREMRRQQFLTKQKIKQWKVIQAKNPRKIYLGDGKGNGKRTAEFRNKHSTCEAQLRTRIIVEAKRYGIQPGRLSCKPPTNQALVGSCKDRYGSWTMAKQILFSLKANEATGSPEWTGRGVLLSFKAFKDVHGHMPYSYDFGKNKGLPAAATCMRLFGNGWLNKIRQMLGWPIILTGWRRDHMLPTYRRQVVG